MDMQPPAGGDQNRGGALTAIFWAEGAIAIIVVALRFWGRTMVKGVGPDDWMMLVTLILFLILAAFVTYLASIGGCRHLFYLTTEQQLNAVKYNWICQPWGIFGFATGKISVALLVIRLIGPNTFWRKWILYLSMLSVFIINALGCILTFVQCNPPRALWTPSLVATNQAQCWHPEVQSNYAIFLSSWNIFIDVLLALLPATILYRLKLPMRKKMILSLLLGLGLLAAVCGIVKINFLAGLSARSDLTWETYNLFAWSGAELFVIIVCGSIPPMKPIYTRFFAKPKPKSSRTDESSYLSGSGSRHDAREMKILREVKSTTYVSYEPQNSVHQWARLPSAPEQPASPPQIRNSGDINQYHTWLDVDEIGREPVRM